MCWGLTLVLVDQLAVILVPVLCKKLYLVNLTLLNFFYTLSIASFVYLGLILYILSWFCILNLIQLQSAANILRIASSVSKEYSYDYFLPQESLMSLWAPTMLRKPAMSSDLGRVQCKRAISVQCLQYGSCIMGRKALGICWISVCCNVGMVMSRA